VLLKSDLDVQQTDFWNSPEWSHLQVLALSENARLGCKQLTATYPLLYRIIYSRKKFYSASLESVEPIQNVNEEEETFFMTTKEKERKMTKIHN
jgi:hypothetical protein